MRYLITATSAVALLLSSCNRPAWDASAGRARHGRYSGVGIYPAGQMWSQVAMANAPKDAAASKIRDDEQIIVIIDGATGELRECGNLSGYCVGMNPFATPLASSQVAPVALAKHAEQIAHEAEAAGQAQQAKSTAP